MKKEKYDIAIIGAGPGGFSAAQEGIRSGAKVCIIEKGALGGTCVNRGCIPTKAIRSSVMAAYKARNMDNYGINIGPVTCNYKKIIERARNVVEEISKGMHQLIVHNKIDLFSSEAKITSANTIELEDGKITADNIIIATGSMPRSLPDLEFDNKRIFSTDGILDRASLPEKILIIGAGVNGCEWSFIFSVLGVKVILSDIEEHILPGEDEDIVRVVEKELKNLGVEILLGKALNVDSTIVKEAECIMVCIGRIPPINGIGNFETINGGWIKVDDRFQTSIKGVYAVGDVIGPPLFAYTAEREGKVAVENIRGASAGISYKCLPRVVFTYPEVAAVGLTQSKAKEQGYDVGVSRAYFKGLGRAIAEGETSGYLKVIYDKTNYLLLGVGIVGHSAGELIGEAVLALEQKLTLSQWRKVLRPHPVFSEIFAIALEKAK